ncbi:MAG: VOC family protein [Cyanobacteria bacterium J06598_3]
MKNSHFHHEAFVTLASSKLDQQVAFYSGLLNISPQPNTPAYAEFQLNRLRLAIFTPSRSNATEFAAASDAISSSAISSGPMSLCLEVSDLERAIAQLHALGHAPPGEIMHTSHGQEIYAYDPDGNRLILHQSPKSS